MPDGGTEPLGRPDQSEQLLLAMKRAGLTQEALAARLHTNPRVLRRYLSGERIAPPEIIEGWERECGLEAGALSGGVSADAVGGVDAGARPSPRGAVPSRGRKLAQTTPGWRRRSLAVVAVILLVIVAVLVTMTRSNGPTGRGVPSAVIRYPASPPVSFAEPPSSPVVGPDGTVLVPAGPFLRGSTAEQLDTIGRYCQVVEALRPLGCSRDDFTDEYPQASVTMGAYWIDRDEVTNEQFGRFVTATSYVTTAEMTGASRVFDSQSSQLARTEGANWRNPQGPGSTQAADRPVVHVSWEDARSFCAWAGKRLPTEAEWEKAARGPFGRVFPWGDEWDPDESPARLSFPHLSPGPSLQPVGSFVRGRSPYGVNDMLGNAFEWVADWYDPAYYKVGSAQNPAGPDAGTEKILRGGSWGTNEYLLRVSWRRPVAPTETSSLYGFRCARSV